MELLIVGTLEGQIGAASKIAIQQGGHVSIADNEEAGLDVLRSGKAIELVMIDVKLDVYKFISSLEQERINVLVVACGVANDPSLAVKAIKAGRQRIYSAAAGSRNDWGGAGRGHAGKSRVDLRR